MTATTEWIFQADERRASEGDGFMCVLECPHLPPVHVELTLHDFPLPSISEAPTGSPNGWVVPDSTDGEPYPQVSSQTLMVPLNMK